MGLNVSNGFIIGIYPSYAPYTPQSATNGTLVPSSGTVSGGNMTYSIFAEQSATGQYITLIRSTNGAFTCSAPLSGPYAGVC